MNGQAQLQRLRQALRDERAVPADLREWLEQGIAAFESGARLEEALSLHSPRDRRRQRNDHIRRAGRLLGDAPATSKATAIQRAERQLLVFLEEPETVERYVRHEWQLEVFRALQCAPLPKWNTIRQLVS
ncbi:MAG: hypothetical protein V2J19_04065 [Wenzhouxiangella sp.]|jgi:hypothetical protein|nr:hypothetical protein [Wenzhouxiangella sp.]